MLLFDSRYEVWLTGKDKNLFGCRATRSKRTESEHEQELEAIRL
jgi:hypothetical protein